MKIQVTVEGVRPDEWYYPSLSGATQLAPHNGEFETQDDAIAWSRTLLLELTKFAPSLVGLDVVFRVYEGLRVGVANRSRKEQHGTLLAGAAYRMVADSRGLRWRRVLADAPPPPDTVRKIQQPRPRKPATGATYNDETGEV